MTLNPTSWPGAGRLSALAWGGALRAALLATLCGATGAVAEAQDAPATAADLRVNGFGTLGLVEVTPHDDWGFRRDISQASRHDSGPRADVDSRLGLQAAWRLDPQWEFVGQLVLKPRADEAADDESLAWAFAAWRPTPEWTLRAGRTSPDLFLLSDVRNVGFAYPWMRPNVEFYGWVPVSALDGLDVTRQWQLGDGRLRAKLFAGRTSVTLASTQGPGDTHANVRPLAGGTLTWDCGALTVKATLAQARSRARDPAAVGQAHVGLDGLAGLPIPVVASQAAQLRDSFPKDVFVTRYAALGMAWDASPWQLQAELARISGNFDSSDSWYGYASAARRFGATTLFATVGRARASHQPLPDPQWTASLTPVLGPALAAAAQGLGQSIASSYNLAREDQGSIGIGARLDLDDRIAVKFQLDAVRSAAFGGGLWSHDTREAHHALVWSTGLDFVF